MNAFTKKHLKAWLQSSVFSDERRKVGKLIRAYVHRYPEALESQSWPEILRLAEASGMNPRTVSVLQEKRAARERAAQIRKASGRNSRRNVKLTIGEHVKFHGHDGKDYAATIIGTKRGYFEVSYYVPGTGTVKALVKKKDTATRFNPAELLVMAANPRVEVVHGDNPPVEEIAEEFSGVDVKYLDVYNEPHIPRGRYAYLAKLFRLLIKPDKGGQVQKITFAEEHAPVIVSDSTGKQIYFVDGNQDISEALPMFADEARSDGKFNLGAGRELHYIGKKHHIGDEDTDEWRHKHGEEDGILPAVVFDPVNKKLLYEGGNYRIEGPWIHN